MTAHQSIPLFRPEVLNARKDRLHGDISLGVPLPWQAIGYLLFIIVAVAIVFLSVATYSRVEVANGAIVVDKGTAPIVATRPGVIAALSVVEGQHVKAGESLALIRAEEDLASGGTAPQRVLDSLNKQDLQLASQVQLMLNASTADRSRSEETIRGAENELQSIDQQIAEQQQMVALSEHDISEVESIASKGFISRRDLDDRKATLLSRRQQLAQLKQARTAKLASIADAQRSIAESLATARAQAASIESERSQLQQQIAQFDAAKGYALTSPMDGTVTALTARSGQPLAQGQQLMLVIPAGGRIQAELYVPTSAAGFLHRGENVRLAVDSFPYQQFGTLSARIADIASAPVLRQVNTKDATPVYIITAELAQKSVRAFGQRQALLPGMTLTARIVTRKQTLLEWLFEPIFAVARR